MKKLRLRLRTSFSGCPAAAYRWKPTIRLHQKLASREPDIYRTCSLPLLHFVLFLRKRQSRIKWGDTIFFFFLKKSKFQRLLWGQYRFSFQSSLLLDPQALKWKLTLKLVTLRQDPQPENNAQVRPAAAYLPGPESRLIRMTEIYLQELKAKGICFNLSSLCTGWPKSLFRILQSNLWPTWSFWPPQ